MVVAEERRLDCTIARLFMIRRVPARDAITHAGTMNRCLKAIAIQFEAVGTATIANFGLFNLITNPTNHMRRQGKDGNIV